MKTIALIAIVVAIVGCTTRAQYDYFEPSGFGTLISSPSEGPPNVAQATFDGSTMSVSARPEGSEVVLSIVLEVARHSRIRFASGYVEVRLGDHTDRIVPVCETLILDHGVGRFERQSFDDEFVGRSFDKKPSKTQVENSGSYAIKVSLPDRYLSVDRFEAVLPSPRSGVPIHITFVRRHADFRAYVQLQ